MAIDDPEIVGVSVIEPPSSVVEVDDNEMDNEFRRMSISQDTENYDYKTNPEVDEKTRELISRLTEEDSIRYTRRTATRREDTITLEEDEDGPDSISTGLKQKYSPVIGKSTPARRTSSKIVPLDSYVSLCTRITLDR